MSKWSEPRYWKQLERHPLSEEYGDFDRAQMLADLKEYGNVDDRKISVALDETDDKWKVVEGWQFYQCHIELGIKPTFKPVAGRIPLDAFVRVKNDNRRHETPESTAKRVAARQARVAAAREAGESLRAIAEKENVSDATVRSDLETASTAQGCAVEPETGKVTGKDGRQQPATRKEKPGLIDELARLNISPKLTPELAKLPRGDQEQVVKLIGEGLNPRKAFDEVKREPGDETPPTMSNGHPMPSGRGSKPGKVFDDSKVTDLFGKLYRTVNDKAKAYGLRSVPAEVREPLNAFLKAFKAWKPKS